MELRLISFITIFCAMLSGCAGSLYTHTNVSSACINQNGKCTGVYEGVLYRPLIKYTETYLQDRILNSEGDITHFANAKNSEKSCIPTRVEEEKLIPDPDNQYLVQYDPAFFETSTFTVKLSPQGTLSEVGTTSTPGGKSLVESFTGLATTIKMLNHGPEKPQSLDDVENRPFCSHGRISETDETT